MAGSASHDVRRCWPAIALAQLLALAGCAVTGAPDAPVHADRVRADEVSAGPESIDWQVFDGAPAWAASGFGAVREWRPASAPAAANLPGVMLLTAASAGWSDADLAHLVAGAAARLQPCGIGLADTRIVRAAHWPDTVDDPGDWRGWLGQLARIPGTPGLLVVLVDEVDRGVARHRAAGRSIRHRRGHLLLIERSSSGVDAPAVLAHELGHVLGLGHDAPGAAPTAMARRACSQCRFSSTQCTQMRTRLHRADTSVQ